MSLEHIDALNAVAWADNGRIHATHGYAGDRNPKTVCGRPIPRRERPWERNTSVGWWLHISHVNCAQCLAAIARARAE